MITEDPGHSYILDELDGISGLNHLLFVKRDYPPEKYPGNIGHHPGTTIQEVMRAIIARLKYVNQQIPSAFDEIAIEHARSIIICLEKRNAFKKGRTLDLNILLSDNIEDIYVCRNCGHIICEEHEQ